jgi:hypothetical protein
MSYQPRRIVTGHNAAGKSVVLIDGPSTPFGAYWLTDSIPVNNTGIHRRGWTSAPARAAARRQYLSLCRYSA